jgi:hypothetical protein
MGRIIATERISLDGVVEARGNVWRLWKAGIVRANYARADEPGVAIVFELDSVEDGQDLHRRLPADQGRLPGAVLHPAHGSAPDREPVQGRD